jgi:hypothetical protein
LTVASLIVRFRWLNLAVRPGMPHLREAVFDPVLATNAVEDVREGVRI